MTNEERDELRRDLEAAGCPWLAQGAGEPLSTMSDDERDELGSLIDHLRVMEAGVRAAARRDIANGAETQESEGAND